MPSKEDLVLPMEPAPNLSTDIKSLNPFPQNSDFNVFVCGWGAAIINITITFPLNKIIFRQVTNHDICYKHGVRDNILNKTKLLLLNIIVLALLL